MEDSLDCSSIVILLSLLVLLKYNIQYNSSVDSNIYIFGMIQIPLEQKKCD